MPIIGSSASQNTKSFLNPYPIGSAGPGGGKVFYDAGSILSWGRYLEAAPNNWDGANTYFNNYVWSGNTSTLVGTSTTIGTGMSNTLAIVAQSSTASRAGTICRAYTGGGYSSSSTGWFLPSKDELNQLYTQIYYISGVFNPNDDHWSSSESSNNTVWTQDFSNSAQRSYYGKGNAFYVRPIRAFS